ncbi:Putative adhesin [Bryocella elongata]|uniref:Putative adhesin n=1 Tax=Bryocella elongata TaxID=863522 RepID=A0A1H6CCC4_9BACT|nr:DUF4097 family beta strand repeat-containing protein [Bryocella elongata]SEG70604.1 Putative adhesin [Bryocella elongata]
MSAYPPPPSGSPFPPNSREAWKAQQRNLKEQRRAMKYQARMQRAQWRVQRRALRRRSIVGPLVLVLLGVLFLLAQGGRISWGQLIEWYGRWWPIVLIAAGMILLLEWALDHSREDEQGQPAPGRILGAGVVLLLMCMAAVGIGLRYSNMGMEWRNHWFGPGWTGLAQAVGDEHDSDSSNDHEIAQDGSLVIRSPHGDVTVTGTSDDGKIHVSTHKHVWAWQDSDAQAREQELEPSFSGSNSHVILTIASTNAGQADITIEVPETTTVTVEANRGAVNVSSLHATVEVTSNHGNVDLGDITGSVSLHMNNDDGSLNGHDITGTVTLEGHAGDITLTDVGGPVSLQGDFFGTTHVERVRNDLRFATSRTQFEAQRVDGTVEISGGSNGDLEGHEILGPVVLKTRNRNITLERLQGSVSVTNRNGDVNITQAPPLASVQVDNSHGSVNVGLPEGQGFSLSASTRHGDLENDFDVAETTSGDRKILTGSVSGGGPAVTLTTTDGDVTVRKTSVEPLAPPPPPAPPAVPALPARPARPAKPARPAPEAKPAPAAHPAAPSAVTF